MGIGRCTPQSVQLSQGGTNTMGLKIDIFLTEASFIFLRLWVLCPEFNSQSDNFCDFNPVLPLSGKCPPNPKYWAFLSDISWKWNVLLLSTLLYIYFFNLGSENGCCAKTLQGCLAFMTSPPTLIKMQARASYEMFMRNGFGDWMARCIEKTILGFILYNLTSWTNSILMNDIQSCLVENSV